MTVKQVPPVTAASATVVVTFQVGEPHPDIVEVYAHNSQVAVGGRQDLAQSIPIVSGQSEYEVTISNLQAGGLYVISVCPRTLTGESLDEEIEGQYWESYCVAFSIFTKAGASPGGNTRPPPIISSVVAEPATVSGDGTITVTWQAAVSYDKYLIWWTESGIANRQGEVEARGSTGTWTASSTKPGLAYTFAVDGGISTFWDYKYSGWGPTVYVTGPSNLRSLRAYLQHSGIDPIGQTARSFLPAGGSLRPFMKL